MKFALTKWIVVFALHVLVIKFIHQIEAADLSNITAVQKRPLYIGSMAPMTGIRAWWGAGIPLAIKMAFEDINQRSDILKEYKLNLIPRDTQVRHQSVT